ncbi:PREDICTED: interferon regulatory factor 6-like isoform X1 [Branchiostoma belcheri]|uniref:Interferon regulatory factor 6-like isoform X1 n=2 Tax=Branchiostoma belcheri TaxID=7741 RepID=A0A6P5AES7_BRABE|nr:PREDICTED: interferon regulatory factor 6-like isoform X1 [Branchiostoma belcheri]
MATGRSTRVREPTMPVAAVPDNSRDRLRPWLYGMIDRGEVPGVEWIDAAAKKFKIPWKHAGKHEYDQDRDSKLFKEWAVHTGKFRPGIDKPEPAVWKTRLRCALNKHPKIHEVKKESQPEDPINPYKVYVFSDKPIKSDGKERHRSGSVSSGNSSDGYEDSRSPEEAVTLAAPQQIITAVTTSGVCLGNSPPRIQTFAGPQTQTYTTATASLGDTALTSSVREDSLQKILQDLLSQPGRGDGDQTMAELLQGMEGQQFTLQEVAMDVTTTESPAVITEPLYTSPPIRIETQQLANVDMNQLTVGAEVTCDEDMETDDVTTKPVAAVAPELRIYPAHELDIEVIYYKAGKVFQHHVTDQRGCRLWFGDRNQPNLRQTVDPTLSSYLYGPADAEQILLPPRQPSGKQKDDDVVQGLLVNMERGLVLTTDNGNISATRLCKTKVFWKSNDNRNRQAERLEREQRVLVFDYQNYLRELSAYGNSGGQKPKSEVIFSFGKGWSDEIPLENTPIYVIVRSRTAHNLMMAVDKGATDHDAQNALRSIDAMVSNSNEFDKLAVDVKEYVKVKDF